MAFSKRAFFVSFISFALFLSFISFAFFQLHVAKILPLAGLDDSCLSIHLEDSDIAELAFERSLLEIRQPVPLVPLDCITRSGPLNLDIEDECNFACAMILCAGRPDHLTKNSSASRHNRVMSGHDAQPYAGTAAAMAALGVTRLNAVTVSPEEYPFASTNEGGSGDQTTDNTPIGTRSVTMGVDPNQQQLQGGRLAVALQAAGVNDGDPYQIRFDSNSKFCVALNQVPPDTSVCEPDPNDKTSPLNRAYIRDNPPRTKMRFRPITG